MQRPSAETKEKALQFIHKIEKGFVNNKLYYWKITEKGSNEMLGSICLWNFSDDGKIGEVGYDLNPKFQGKGIMDESLKSIIDFAFNKLFLNKIEAFTQVQNKPSIQLLERNGFRLDATRSDNDNPDNSIFILKTTAN